MAQINKPNTYFNTVLYTGNSSTQSITGVNFQPDFTWLKCRNDAQEHRLTDAVRGTTKGLESNSAIAEFTTTNTLTSFDSDGFSLGNAAVSNYSGNTHVAWNWLASNTTASNTDGSITSTVSVNTTSGFSIVSYTGTGATATVGHGLSQTPEMIIVKLRSGSGTDWITWGSILGGTVGSELIKLNLTSAKTTGLNSSWFNNTAPTSSVFTIGTQSDLNGSGSTYIGYCFHSVKGYSKSGRYTGNGSTDGTFVYTGFKPAFILVKNTQTTVNSWEIHDNKRDTFNVGTKRLYPNANASEGSGTYVDMLSNGFKWRSTDGGHNSANTFIYMAFAENPLVGTNNIPATAR